MEPLALRDPVSSLSHLFGCAAGLYLTLLFWRLTRGDSLRRCSAVCFGLCMTILYAASTAYHAVISPDDVVHFFRKLDHSAIYLLIAGTYTPIFAILLTGRLRASLLIAMWTVATVGIILKWLVPLGPHELSVGIYLAMGWLGLIPSVQLIRAVGWKGMTIALLGGLFYTTGGICDTLGWPILYAPAIRSHEFMHFMDLAGTSAHVFFILRYVLPYRS